MRDPQNWHEDASLTGSMAHGNWGRAQLHKTNFGYQAGSVCNSQWPKTHISLITEGNSQGYPNWSPYRSTSEIDGTALTP